MYPNYNTLLVSVNDMKGIGILDANLDERTLLPVVKYVQDEMVHNLIGTKLYERLIGLIDTGEINLPANEHYKELLRGYIFYIMGWKVKAEACVDLNKQVRNFGVGTVSDDRVNPDGWSDMLKTSRFFHARADKYVAELARFIRCNCRCFPELDQKVKWWEKAPEQSPSMRSFIYFPKKKRYCR